MVLGMEENWLELETMFRGPWDGLAWRPESVLLTWCHLHLLNEPSIRSRQRQRALGLLLESGQVVFLASILLSTDHVSRTLNGIALSSLRSLLGRFYREGMEVQEGCAKVPGSTSRAVAGRRLGPCTPGSSRPHHALHVRQASAGPLECF